MRDPGETVGDSVRDFPLRLREKRFFAFVFHAFEFVLDFPRPARTNPRFLLNRPEAIPSSPLSSPGWLANGLDVACIPRRGLGTVFPPFVVSVVRGCTVV